MLETTDKESGFKAEFFQDLYELESGNFWFRSRSRLIIWAMKRYFARANSFLEIGCGTGYVLSGIRAAIPQLEVAGSELFAEGLSFARKRLPEVDLMELDCRDLKMSAKYDVIGAFDVVEHITEDELVFRQMYEACRLGVIIAVPQHQFLWSVVDEYSLHKRRYSLPDLRTKMEKAGFQIAWCSSYISLLLPLLLMSRAKKKDLSDFDPGAELKLPKLLNFALEVVCNIERVLITSGLRFPMGGSLIVVAYKK